jgi:alpha-glucosidase
MNVMGQRIDGTRQDQLILRVYADQEPSQFTLYEDDGETVAYQQGAVRTTLLSQVQSSESVTVTIAGATGIYAGAPISRSNRVELDVDGPGLVISATLNGTPLPLYEDRAEFEAEPVGWHRTTEGLILAKSGPMDVDQAKVFAFYLGRTTYLPLISRPK